MISRSAPVVFLLITCFFAGCVDEPQYRLLPAPAQESPVINPPLSIRQSNWYGGPRKDEGSCAHASLVTMLQWQNEFALAKKWKETYDGGEYASRIRKRLDGFKIKYAYTENANLALLDFAHDTRRGAIIWWGAAHCCTFVGWVQYDGKTYAAILDNNNTKRYEFTEIKEFHRRWASYGGFALTTLGSPPSLPPYRSLVRVQ